MNGFRAVILTAAFAMTAVSQTQVASLSFSPPMEEFTVLAPCAPQEVENEQEWKIYKCNIGDRWIFITSNIDESSSQIEAIKRQASSKIEFSEKSIGLSSSSYTAQILAFADYDGLFQKVVALRTSRRYYIFHAISYDENDPRIASFIESITINREPQIERLKQKYPKSIISVIQTGRATNGRISKEHALLYRNPNEGKQFVPASDQNSKFKLLKKESPAYTPLAFLYEIQGEVLVRVTFKASGQIGDVSTAKKLPLGLTANAIAAAKFMVFEPPVENGKARTVTRPVSFGFNIY